MFSELEKYKVRELLLTPIICKKNMDGIRRQNGLIVSSQQYYSFEDEDMSDIAVGFYEVLYGKTLLENSEILEKDGKFINKEFAGDTMNSFNTIANVFNNSFYYDGGNIKVLNNKFLLNYQARYHCLANFWLIPMRHGRMSAKKLGDGKSYDSPILYTEQLKKEWDNIKEPKKIQYDTIEYENYFNKIHDIENFKEIHYLPEIENVEELEKFYKDKNGLELVEIALDYIYKRADKICQDEDMIESLWKYFKKLELL